MRAEILALSQIHNTIISESRQTWSIAQFERLYHRLHNMEWKFRSEIKSDDKILREIASNPLESWARNSQCKM